VDNKSEQRVLGHVNRCKRESAALTREDKLIHVHMGTGVFIEGGNDVNMSGTLREFSEIQDHRDARLMYDNVRKGNGGSFG